MSERRRDTSEPLRRKFACQLWQLADLIQARERLRSFSALAYRRAIWSLDALPGDLDIGREQVAATPGIGPGIAKLAEEFRRTGNLCQLSVMRESYPEESARLRRLPRMTPKHLVNLKTELAVDTRADLVRAIETGAVRSLVGVGPKTESLWLRTLELNPDGRSVPAANAWTQAVSLARHFSEYGDCEIDVAGEVRRLEEWVSEIDLIATTSRHDRLTQVLSETAVLRASTAGDDMHLGETHFGTPVKVEYTIPESAGTSLLWATGPPEHAASISTEAFPTEEEAYRSVGLSVIPPAARSLPLGEASQVVRSEDIRGDFHLHSTASSDGRMELDQIAAAAIDLGYEYILITDHTYGLRFGGLDDDQIRAQSDDISQLRTRFPALRIFHGAELNIDADGSLDLDDESLERLDFALAAIHSHFGLDQKAQTGRLLGAIEHPKVRILAHPFGRRVGLRPPLDVDMDRVAEACREKVVALESNGHRDRLDLPSDWIRRIAPLGVHFAANSDAHRIREMGNVANAVANLQKAGVTTERVINSFSLTDLEAWLE